MKLLTIGTFDIPHAGHAAFLRQCEDLADEVLVGVNSDQFVADYKGERPVYDEHERMQLVRAMGYRPFLNHGPGHELIRALNPDIVAIGTDWARKDYFAQIETPIEYFETQRMILAYVPYTAGMSTTDIKARLT